MSWDRGMKLTVHRAPDGALEVRRGAELVALRRRNCRRWAVARQDGLGLYAPASPEQQRQLEALVRSPERAA